VRGYTTLHSQEQLPLRGATGQGCRLELRPVQALDWLIACATQQKWAMRQN